jgi:hypothetical protein
MSHAKVPLKFAQAWSSIGANQRGSRDRPHGTAPDAKLWNGAWVWGMPRSILRNARAFPHMQPIVGAASPMLTSPGPSPVDRVVIHSRPIVGALSRGCYLTLTFRSTGVNGFDPNWWSAIEAVAGRRRRPGAGCGSLPFHLAMAGRSGPSLRAAAAPCHRWNPHQRSSQRPVRTPSARRSRPCPSAPSDAGQPTRAAPHAQPARAPGQALQTTPGSGHRIAATSLEACERVSPQRRPLCRWIESPRQAPISQPARASSCYGTLKPLPTARSTVDPG